MNTWKVRVRNYNGEVQAYYVGAFEASEALEWVEKNADEFKSVVGISIAKGFNR